MKKKTYIFVVLLICLIAFPVKIKAYYLTNEECKRATNCSRDCSPVNGSTPYSQHSCAGKTDGESCGPGGGFLQGAMGTCVSGTCWQTPPNYTCTENWSDPDVNRNNPGGGGGNIEEPNYSIPGPDLGDTNTSCSDLLGTSLTKIVNIALDMIQIVGVIICIVNGMLVFVPAVIGKDDSAMKVATKKMITMLIICAVIGLFPDLLALIANLFGFDFSCFV